MRGAGCVSSSLLLFFSSSQRPAACASVSVPRLVPCPRRARASCSGRTHTLMVRMRTQGHAHTRAAHTHTHKRQPAARAGLRPDNAPICTPTLTNPPLAFATLRGGGLLVVDYTKAGAGLHAQPSACLLPSYCLLFA